MRLLRRLLFLAFLLMVLLVCGELWVRFHYSYTDLLLSPQNLLYQDHPVLLWTLRKNSTLLLDTVSYTTNSFGMRSPEPAIPKPPESTRILLLGESSTMGTMVEENRSYAGILRSRLGVDVVNAGVGAWSIYQSWTFLQLYGEFLKPDMVVVYHQANDFLPMGVVDRHNFLYAVSATDRELIERRKPIAPFLKLLQSSQLYLAVRKQVLLYSRLPVLEQNTLSPGRRVPDADREIAWQGIWDFCKVRDIYLLVILPMYMRAYDDDRVLLDFLKRNELPFLNIPRIAQKEGFTRRSFLQDETHPSPSGHALIARAIEMQIIADWQPQALVPP